MCDVDLRRGVAASVLDDEVAAAAARLLEVERGVATLLLPVHAPWSKASELIDYVRAVHADQAFAVHDGLLNDAGLGLMGGLLGERGPGTPTPFSRLAPGDSVEL